jgi:hypothetical protein
VIALRDHFWDKWNVQRVGLPQSHLGAPNHEAPVTVISKEDEWALEYLSALRLQSISEAFDDDASGFVTVNEVNAFTTSRPEGWRYVFDLTRVHILMNDSLPHWIAYWAIGLRFVQLYFPHLA